MTLYKTWSKEMAHEFFLYKRIMWPLGSWPLDRSENFAKFRTLFVTVMQTTMVVYLSIEICYHDNKKFPAINMAINHYVLVVCGTLAILKIHLIRLHRSNLSENLCNAASDWIYIVKHDYRQVMIRYTNLGRFVFFLQMCTVYVVLVPLIMGSLLSFVTLPSLQNITLSVNFEEQNGRQTVVLPLEMICPYKELLPCFGMCVLQIIQVIGTATGNVGSDVFFFSICMHLCSQLEILALEMLHFNEREENHHSWNKVKLAILIERHCLLLNLAKKIVGTLDIILIAQLMLHASLICVIGLQFIISLAYHNLFLVLRSIMALNLVVAQIFLYSYMGEFLSTKSQDISCAVYLGKWYGLPIDIIRDIYFITARAAVPIRIRAGKFYDIDFNSFKNTIKVSFSYLSVLQIMLTQ